MIHRVHRRQRHRIRARPATFLHSVRVIQRRNQPCVVALSDGGRLASRVTRKQRDPRPAVSQYAATAARVNIDSGRSLSAWTGGTLNRTPRSRVPRPTCDTSAESGRHIHREFDACGYQNYLCRMPSRWGQLAREGHQVVQFKDSGTNRFVAVVVDGAVTVHGWRTRGKGAAG